MSGVGGTCVFEFQAIGSSREPFNLNFVHKRPWENTENDDW